MATRLYFLVTRRAPMAVVFRRGPTRQVELLTWDLRTWTDGELQEVTDLWADVSESRVTPDGARRWT